ncbi:MAG: COR domain-containing protein [Cyanobacteria bacterium J06634_5]
MTKAVAKDKLLRLIDEAASNEWTELSLFGKNLTELPSEIGQLTNLKALYIYDNQLSHLPSEIGQLINLKTLYIYDNQLSHLPSEIGQLINLKTLDVNFNQLRSLPESVVHLPNLKTLSLSYNQLNSLPESIGQLANLQNLYLRGNQLNSLPESIGQLVHLQKFYLLDNGLSRLPESVGKLINLKELYLGNNQLSHLPESIGRLGNLKELDLSNNNLTSLPKSARNATNLRMLDLRSNLLPIPPELLESKGPCIATPCPAWQILDFYFSILTEEDIAPLYEAKLILVGAGGAGKTSLAKKIYDETYELQPDEKTTQGINVIRWNFFLENGSSFRVNIWDFGGQEIYHATHQFFLTKRSLYLLVADTRQEDCDYAYWLNIVSLLSDCSPVLIIKNEKQDRQCELDEGYFKGKFNNLKDSLSTNLKDNRGLNGIRDAIRYHLSQLPHTGTPLPTFWVRVRTELEEAARHQNTLTIEKYFDICRRHNCDDKQKMLFVSEYLHDLGVCLHFQEDTLLKRTLILRPEWATAAVYAVIDSDIVRKNKGCFSTSDLARIWQDEKYTDFRDELLQLMKRFKLAYKLPNMRDHYIAPQLLPITQPYYFWDFTDNLILRYHYEFMPKGILTRFIVETHQMIENQQYVWKNGVVLADTWARAQVIECYSANEINIRVSGTNKKPLLEAVRNEFRRIHNSYERLRYRELIPCNCSECKDRSEPEFYSYDLLMQYIAKQRYSIECRTSIDKVDIRCLVSDITDTPIRGQPVSDYSRSSHISTVYNIENMIGNFSNQSNQRKMNDMSTINQYGQCDNIAGDKVMGDKIKTQINNNPDLAQAARDIKDLLNNLSEEYNPNSSKGQAKIELAALAEIEQNPTLKQRSVKALKSVGEEVLEQAIQHPVAKVVVKGLKGFVDG